jgi:hypothetical protein
MAKDNYWAPDGRLQDFHFEACSGTRWRQIDDESHNGHVQLKDIPDNSDMVLLQAGGNNAGFADVYVLPVIKICVTQTGMAD